MVKFSKHYLEETIKVWQPRYKEPLSLEQAQEIAENITALYSYLLELEIKYYTK